MGLFGNSCFVVSIFLKKSVMSLMYDGKFVTFSSHSFPTTSAIFWVGRFMPLIIVLNGFPFLYTLGFALTFSGLPTPIPGIGLPIPLILQNRNYG